MITLAITGDFEATRNVVIAAMLFPRNAEFRASYCLRNHWQKLAEKEAQHTLTSAEVRELVNIASRGELSEAADAGVKQGPVAGDLLSLIYEQWRLDKPWPSMRGALSKYSEFAIGKKYGDGEALKYSNMQLRTYFDAAAPSAHLWGAYRLLKIIKDRGKAHKAAFTPEGLPLLLGVARDLQDFATTYVPKGTKPAKPIIQPHDFLHLPETISPVRLPLRVL
ncbi:MAG: hypothetical protein Q8J78_15455 [Moraxellaceae bacterium]|nr:hypothetical protein [Moraxellaceae bacterium]